MWFILIFLNILTGQILGSEQCFGGKLHVELRDASTTKPVLAFGLNFVLSPDFFGSHAVFSNVTKWALNSKFDVTGPLQFWWDGQGISVSCPANSSLSCHLTIPDGSGVLELPVLLNGERGNPMIMMGVNFDTGTVYRSKNGLFFDRSHNRCLTLENAVTTLPNYVIHFSICCVDFRKVNVPIVTPQCVEFESHTSLNFSTFQSQISSKYVVHESGLEIQIENYTIPSDAEFYLQPNEDAVTCSSMNLNCTQPLEEKHDFELQLALMVTDAKSYRVTSCIGRLIRMNGVFFGNNNQVFSQSAPCSDSSMQKPNVSASSSLCCSKFAPHSPSDKCAEYESRTIFRNVATNSELGHLQIKYLLSDLFMDVSVRNFTAFNTSNGMFYNPTDAQVSGQCKMTTENPAVNCRIRMVEMAEYPLSFRTSFAPDGFVLFKAMKKSNQFLEPEITVVDPCMTQTFNYNDYFPKMVAKTTICCISTVDGPWPDGY